MSRRINYRELINNWMQYYALSTEASRKMFISIWTQLQELKRKKSMIKE